MNFPERLNFLINQIGITKKAFAIQCDISKAQIFNYLAGKQEPKAIFFRIIKEHYSWINLEWLITGEGELDLRKTTEQRKDEFDLKRIGGRIGYIRAKSGETQSQFAEKTGLSKGNLSGLENHEYEPSYRAIIKILKSYNVNPRWFLFGEGKNIFLKENLVLPGIDVDVLEEYACPFKNKGRAINILRKAIIIEHLSETEFKKVESLIYHTCEVTKLMDQDTQKQDYKK
jgi:transcriptional regulator with XRE-family HTH domain